MKKIKITLILIFFAGIYQSCNETDSLSFDSKNTVREVYQEKGLLSKTLMQIDIDQPLDYESFKSQMIANAENYVKIANAFKEYAYRLISPR